MEVPVGKRHEKKTEGNLRKLASLSRLPWWAIEAQHHWGEMRGNVLTVTPLENCEETA